VRLSKITPLYLIPMEGKLSKMKGMSYENFSVYIVDIYAV
jgi:hypothetical protein